MQFDKSDEEFIRKIIYEEVKRAFSEMKFESRPSKADTGEEFLSIDDVAAMLCVKRTTVKRMNVERKIPFDKPNKFPRYRKSDVLAYMKKVHIKSMDEIHKDAEEYMRAHPRG